MSHSQTVLTQLNKNLILMSLYAQF